METPLQVNNTTNDDVTKWRIQREGGQLYAECMGAGPPLVMLRGWGRSLRHWLGFDRRMAKHFRVITMDARGIGKSTAPVHWNLTTADMACDVVHVLDHLQVPDAHFLGVSLGGMVALSFASSFPHRCKSVIAVNASFRGSGAFRLSPRALQAIIGGILNRKRLPERLSRVLISRSAPEELRQEVIKQWTTIDSIEGVDPIVALKQLCAAARFGGQSRIRQIEVPALLIQGVDDVFVPGLNTVRLKELMPNAELLRLPGAGHEASIDQPEALADAVIQFTRRLEERLA